MRYFDGIHNAKNYETLQTYIITKALLTWLPQQRYYERPSGGHLWTC